MYPLLTNASLYSLQSLSAAVTEERDTMEAQAHSNQNPFIIDYDCATQQEVANPFISAMSYKALENES